MRNHSATLTCPNSCNMTRVQFQSTALSLTHVSVPRTKDSVPTNPMSISTPKLELTALTQVRDDSFTGDFLPSCCGTDVTTFLRHFQNRLILGTSQGNSARNSIFPKQNTGEDISEDYL